MDNRPEWGSRAGFILAASGSAIGLGNIWRFPAVAYENGGGAFFLPYLFALLTAGIPLLIMEFAIGQKYRGSAPLSFARLNKKFEWLGWWQVGVSFVIATYYSVIVAWAMSFTIFSVNLKWGDDPNTFLFKKYLETTEVPGSIDGIVPGVLIPLVIVWMIALGILFKGVQKGIEKASKIFMPILIVLFLIIVIRAITLDGATIGLDAFFKPDWSSISNPKVWVAAYGQIFFSLSIGFAIMLTYSSYIPKNTDLTNNAFITGFANSSFELLSGIGVFAALGFMAAQQNLPIDKVVSDGIGLAFVVFPQIINEFPAFNGLFGILFFVCLTLAGLTSLISIIETFVAAVQDKFKVSRTKSVAIGGGIAALVSILYSTRGGLHILDVVDYFINSFGVALVGLAQVVIIAWILRELKNLQNHADRISDIQLGGWWKFSLSFITPIVLGYMMIQNVITNITNNYGGHSTKFIISVGWVATIGVFLLGIVFASFKWPKDIVLKTED